MEIESEQDTDVRSGGRPDTAFSGDSVRNAGTPFISDDDDHDAMRDDANLLHTDDIAGNAVNVVRQEGNRHNDGVEMRKPSKFCSVKWIIMYIFFLLVIGFMLLGTGLLHFIPPPDFHNLTCYAQSDSAIYVEVNLSSIWHYKLNISVKKDCGIGTCIQNCTMESPLNCTALKYDNNTFPSIGAFSPWTFSTSSCFYFDLPQANRDINKYNVTTHYNKRVDILFWPGLPIVLVIIVLFAVSVCHFVWFKIKNRQKYVMFEVNG